MKTGCIVLLFAWVALTALELFLLRGSTLDGHYGAAIGLALLVVLVLANIQGIRFATRKRRAAARHPREWREGDFVAASGPLTVRDPIEAPFSGRRAAIVEYTLKEESSASHDETTSFKTLAQGMLMVPCSVHTSRGAVKLIGFPLLAHVHDERIEADVAATRAGAYLAQASFKEMPSN